MRKLGLQIIDNDSLIKFLFKALKRALAFWFILDEDWVFTLLTFVLYFIEALEILSVHLFGSKWFHSA